VSEAELRLAVILGEFKNNLCAFPLGFVFSEIEVVVHNPSDDLLAGDEFGYFHLATMDVLVVIGKLSAESISVAPDFF